MKPLEDLFDENADHHFTYVVADDKLDTMSKETFINVVEERELEVIFDFLRSLNDNAPFFSFREIDEFDVEIYLKERKEADK